VRLSNPRSFVGWAPRAWIADPHGYNVGQRYKINRYALGMSIPEGPSMYATLDGSIALPTDKLRHPAHTSKSVKDSYKAAVRPKWNLGLIQSLSH
jgi:hypothetical protein